VVSLVGVGRDSAGDVRYSSARVNVTGPVSPHWSSNGEGPAINSTFASGGNSSPSTDRVTLAHSVYLVKVIPNKGDR